MTRFSKTVRNLILVRCDGYCELCSSVVVEVYHHRRPRGAGGSSLPWVNRAANGLGLCNTCHLWVEGRVEGSSRIRSTEVGWLISQHTGQEADTVAVIRRGQRVLLGNDGSVIPLPESETD